MLVDMWYSQSDRSVNGLSSYQTWVRCTTDSRHEQEHSPAAKSTRSSSRLPLVLSNAMTAAAESALLASDLADNLRSEGKHDASAKLEAHLTPELFERIRVRRSATSPAAISRNCMPRSDDSSSPCWADGPCAPASEVPSSPRASR